MSFLVYLGQLLIRFCKWSFENRTRAFGFVQGLVAVAAGMTDILEPDQVKWLLAINAVLTYLLGQFNSWHSKRNTDDGQNSGV